MSDTNGTLDEFSIDPVTNWRLAVAAKFGSGEEDTWWDILVELDDISLDDLIARAKDIGGGNGLEDAVLIPNFYTAQQRAAKEAILYPSLYAKDIFLQEATRNAGQLGIKRIILGTVVPVGQLDTSAQIMPGNLPEIFVEDGSVVTAVIDNGIAFGHELFRKTDPNASRVSFAWIMDAKPRTGSLVVPQGHALARSEIDGLLAANTASGLLDENRFYSQCGLIDYSWPGLKPAAMRVSHGTHVMGLAAGYQPGTKDNTRPIICVQLPTDLTMDVSGAQILPALGRAIDFIKIHAERFRLDTDHGKRIPLVVNFSFGNFAGPHDGTGLIEAKIDHELHSTTQREIQVALPAGNGNLARTHAEITFTDEDTGNVRPASLDWRIQPDDRSASYVEIWMPPKENPDNLVRVRVTPPVGPRSTPVSTVPGETAILHSGDNVEFGRILYTPPHAPTWRGCIVVGVHPTFHHDVTDDLAPSGVWKIEIENVALTETDRIQVWIRRDETLPGFPALGRQSYFDNDDYQRFDSFGAPLPIDPPGSDCLVKRSGTISGFACGEFPAVLAGYVETRNDLAGYSAAGPVTTAFNATGPTRNGPDAAAVSDDTPVLRGILSAGSRCGSLVSLDGTSVATPQVARWMADRLAQGQTATKGDVSAQAAFDDHPPPSRPANTRIGGGRMQRRIRFGPDRKA